MENWWGGMEMGRGFGGIRNKIKGFGQGFRNNKKIVQELGTKIKD